MPKITKPLSDTEIKTTKAKEKDFKISDGQGLYLVIKKNGTKFFRFDFTFQNKRKSMSFGIYPEVSLKEAREKKDKAKDNLKNGINPIETKNSDFEVSTTFECVSNKWLELMKDDWADSTYKKNKETLHNNIYIYIGKKNINELTRIDILNVLKIMEDRGVLELASRVLNCIERIYKYAVTYGYAEHNIIADIDKRQSLKRAKENHYPALTKENDIRKLMIDINNYQFDFRADISTIYALKLAPFVALRPYNLRFLEWNEINFNDKQIEIDGSKMKTKKDFIQPLSKQAFDIIKEVEQFKSSIYLFPSAITNNNPISDNTLTQALKRMGYKNKMSVHGFRAMFSTIMHEHIQEHLFFSDIIELSLAHTERNKIKGAYNRESKTKYLKERHQLMQWWADWLNYPCHNG